MLRSSLYRKILLDVTYWFGLKVTHTSCQRRLTNCRRNKLTPLCSSVTHLCPIPHMFSEPHKKTKYFLQPHRIAIVCTVLLANDWSGAKSIILYYQRLRLEKEKSCVHFLVRRKHEEKGIAYSYQGRFLSLGSEFNFRSPIEMKLIPSGREKCCAL